MQHLLRMTRSYCAALLCVLYLSSLTLTGCSSETQVSEEQQAAGRKSKADLLKQIAAPKPGSEKSSKAKSKRKASSSPDDEF